MEKYLKEDRMEMVNIRKISEKNNKIAFLNKQTILKGTMEYKDGGKYVGNWLNGERHGYGLINKLFRNLYNKIYYSKRGN